MNSRPTLLLAVLLALICQDAAAQSGQETPCLEARRTASGWEWVACESPRAEPPEAKVETRPVEDLPPVDLQPSPMDPEADVDEGEEPQRQVLLRYPLDAEAGDVVVEADKGFVDADENAILEGNVILAMGDQRVLADRVEYRRDDQFAIAEGDIRYSDSDVVIQSPVVEVDTASNTAQLRDLTYEIRRGGGRGTADAARLQSETDITDLEGVTFSTCEPEDLDWYLRADRITLDHDAGRGTARDMSLRFKNVPLFYLPYASFPIDDRRATGFLYPGFGSSSDNGFDFSLPYYWNIRPNMDATFTPRLISDRGLLMEGEYRYLTRRSYGEVYFEYLPDDDDTGDDRGMFDYYHRTRFTSRWTGLVDLHNVSDSAYFEDFRDSLLASSTSYLRSRAELLGIGTYWEFSASLEDYQTVDEDILPSQEPYQRLPRFYFDAEWPLTRSISAGVDTELVNFDRDIGEVGTRFDVYPYVELDLQRSAWYVRPRVGYRYTGYDLDDRDDNDQPSRGLPVASLESGLFFERDSGGDRVQTLEPRIYYLYVPFEEQGDLPQFDTSDLTFGFGQLFRDNRFSGADRQGDANQISLALTTRVLDRSSGDELFTASIGQIVYFRDQRVQLAGRPARDDDTSAFIAEVTSRPFRHWTVGMGLQYDPETSDIDQGLLRLQRRTDRSIWNFGYRRRRDVIGRDSLEQVDVSFYAPLGERINVIGRWNYSLQEDTTLEALAGFEYEACCWALRLMGRRYVRNQDGDKRNGIYLELELKGLGSLGRRTGNLLENAILGYRNRRDEDWEYGL